MCCDLPHQYIDEYFAKLDQSHFPQIKNKVWLRGLGYSILTANLSNQHLTAVDKYRYDEAWERSFVDAVVDYYDSHTLRQNCLVLDLRSAKDFYAGHLPQAINVPLESLSAGQTSPFYDSMTLETQWLELERILGGCMVFQGVDALSLQGKRVLLVCYDGDTARVGTSVLRAKGVLADSVKGGAAALSALTASQKTEKLEGDRSHHLSEFGFPVDELRLPVVA